MKQRFLLQVIGFGALGAGACGGETSPSPVAHGPVLVDAAPDGRGDASEAAARATEASTKDASVGPGCDAQLDGQPGECACGECVTPPNVGQIVMGAGPLPRVGD